ncbi:hypothetical protein B0H14DRAFT_2571013 [Mycena olivaceomarginata]|nr:hypothetical protein B0H14DRAFT_2571013 [Mycena olivaceomarginata]
MGSGRPDAWDWEPFSICWDQGLKEFEFAEYIDGYISQESLYTRGVMSSRKKKRVLARLPKTFVRTRSQKLVVDGLEDELKAHDQLKTLYAKSVCIKKENNIPSQQRLGGTRVRDVSVFVTVYQHT